MSKPKKVKCPKCKKEGVVTQRQGVYCVIEHDTLPCCVVKLADIKEEK